MNTKFYKCCAVPLCKSTSIKTPEKLFIHVPKNNIIIRRKWLTLARRNPKSLAIATTSYFCEDHFDLQKDMENYIEYTTMGTVSQIRMRAGCFPTKFACQPNRSRTTSDFCRPATLKRQRHAIIKECEEFEESNPTNTPSRSSDSPSELQHQNKQQVNVKIDKGVQICIKSKHRSKTIQTKTKQNTKQTSPLKTHSTTSISTSPFKISELQPHLKPQACQFHTVKSFNKSVKSDSDVSMYTPSVTDSIQTKSSSDTSNFSELLDLKKEDNFKFILKVTVDKIEKKPKFYIGVPKNCYFLIQIIHEHTSIPEHQILLCLKKIRLNSKFSELGDEFAMTASYACKIFSKNIPKIAEVMQPFIVKLDKSSIKSCLPIAFRKNYHNVTCIIDCLEIEIQKPSKALHQSLTWSEYKKANTLKYLISSTPNGLINYISKGYGGRISDVNLVENCDFLSCLPTNSYVMADRGFKHIEPLLLGVGCHLIRPPSVASGSKLPKDKVKETKKIASLRIHIERVIRRLREFSMLKPHACINNNLIGKLDDVIVIACGLINLQNSIIKK